MISYLSHMKHIHETFSFIVTFVIDPGGHWFELRPLYEVSDTALGLSTTLCICAGDFQPMACLEGELSVLVV